jgi:hypothetical protein
MAGKVRFARHLPAMAWRDLQRWGIPAVYFARYNFEGDLFR